MPARLALLLLRSVLRFLLVAVFIQPCALALAEEITILEPAPPSGRVPDCTPELLKAQTRCNDSLYIRFAKIEPYTWLISNEFERLEETYRQWCSGKDRLPDGRWMLSLFGDGLYEAFHASQNLKDTYKYLQAWRAAYPDSEAPLYAEAVFWRASAWNIRGRGQGTREAEQLFRQRLERAWTLLGKLGKADFRCAAPYPLLISVMIDRGASAEDVDAVFRRAIQTFPEYHSIYIAAARRHSPRVGGSVEAFERFATEASEFTAAFEGMGMYARLYELQDVSDAIPFENIPERPPYWEKLKAGYSDLLRRYPESVRLLALFTGVTCRSSDSQLYLALRMKLAGAEHAAHIHDSVDVCDARHGWMLRPLSTGPAT